MGYRGQPATAISYSVTAFHTVYDHLRTQEIAPSRTFLFFANEMAGTTSGVETWGSYQASRIWRLSAGFMGLRERLQLKPGSNDASAPSASGKDPAQTWTVRSSLDLPKRYEFDATLRHVSALSNPTVPAYSALDLRVGWRPRRNLDLSVIGQNLLGPRHAEFTDAATRTQFGRGVFFKVSSGF
jgi:iron complex outermembrane receptor protein